VRLLLDTHTLIWYYQTDPKMSATARTLIEDPANGVLVSPASYWEVAIKLSTQRPLLQVPFAAFVQEAIFDNGFTILPIEPRHCDRLIGLPPHHKDPFDRMLIAQALAEGIPLVSADAALDPYGVQRLW
jgi:PIN domain nuclease of toxin-antitoxin system